jgi:hypothetical protein
MGAGHFVQQVTRVTRNCTKIRNKISIIAKRQFLQWVGACETARTIEELYECDPDFEELDFKLKGNSSRSRRSTHNYRELGRPWSGTQSILV